MRVGAIVIAFVGKQPMFGVVQSYTTNSLLAVFPKTANKKKTQLIEVTFHRDGDNRCHRLHEMDGTSHIFNSQLAPFAQQLRDLAGIELEGYQAPATNLDEDEEAINKVLDDLEDEDEAAG